MGVKAILLSLAILVIAVISTIVIRVLNEVPEVPHLENTWWGSRAPEKEDTSIQPFKISISNDTLTDLSYRLKHWRKPVPSLDGVAQEYGINSNLLNEIVEFWTKKYDWRQREKFLNQYPQYKVSVQGLKIHYIHVKPVKKAKNVQVFPLLLLHGWSGSVREFYKVIPQLTEPQNGRKIVFELIIPSLPGYGFSEAAVRPGLGAAQMAVLFKNFMEKLGFKKYYVQGGDWGGIIVRAMTTLFPEKIIGMHSNFCLLSTPMSLFLTLLYSIHPSWGISKKNEHKLYPLSSVLGFYIEETGYLHIQATKPDTIGVALDDSPVGLAAYLFEKFTTYTNSHWRSRMDGGLKLKYSYTDLLDNVMIYWWSKSMTTSMRLYKESFNLDQLSLKLDQIPVTVPSGCARYSNELIYPLDAVLKNKFKNLIHLTDLEGGHYPAFEEPETFINDLYNFVEKTLELKD